MEEVPQIFIAAFIRPASFVHQYLPPFGAAIAGARYQPTMTTMCLPRVTAA
jgi:hypothetical protein